MFRVLITSIVAGIVVQIVSFVSWTVLKVHDATLHNLPQGDRIMEIMRESGAPSGVYHFPGLPTEGEAMESYLDRAKAGPVVTQMVYVSEGVEYANPMPFVANLITNVVAAAIASVFVLFLSPNRGWLTRAILVTAFGISPR